MEVTDGAQRPSASVALAHVCRGVLHVAQMPEMRSGLVPPLLLAEANEVIE